MSVNKDMLYVYGLILTVLVHYFLLIAVICSIPFLIIYEPWYIYIPLIVWIVNLATMPFKCPLTSIENYFRRELGLNQIKGFIHHWVLFRDWDGD